MHIFTLHRAFMQHFSQSIWMPSSDVGGRPLCIVGNGLGIICHKHHPHLLVYRSHYRYHHLLFYWSTDVYPWTCKHLYLLIPGLGMALNFQPSLIMLNRYFSEKRPLANGLAAAGSPVALCCLSPLGQVLQYEYGWRGGFLILGGILLNCCACGALMRPLVPPKKSETPVIENTPDDGNKKAKPKPKLLDFSVFRDPGFVIYTVAASIMVLGLFVPPVFVVSYAKELGNEDTKSALLAYHSGFHWHVSHGPHVASSLGSSGFALDASTSSVSLSYSMAPQIWWAPCLKTTPLWWCSASSLASLMAWWEPCSSRFSWLLWVQRSSQAPLV